MEEPIEFRTKLLRATTSSNTMKVHIPSKAMELGWTVGQDVLLTIDEDRIVIERVVGRELPGRDAIHITPRGFATKREVIAEKVMEFLKEKGVEFRRERSNGWFKVRVEKDIPELVQLAKEMVKAGVSPEAWLLLYRVAKREQGGEDGGAK